MREKKNQRAPKKNKNEFREKPKFPTDSIFSFSAFKFTIAPHFTIKHPFQ